VTVSAKAQLKRVISVAPDGNMQRKLLMNRVWSQHVTFTVALPEDTEFVSVNDAQGIKYLN